MALAIVLVMAFLLTAAVATFARRAVVDVQIVAHREAAARAEALARGGVQIAMHALFLDLIASQAGENQEEEVAPGDTLLDEWARLVEGVIETESGDLLQIEVSDTSSRLNLNALGGNLSEAESEDAVEYLRDVLEHVIGELPITPGERALYEPRELARNFVDYIDDDEERMRGGDENDYYLGQDPPYEAPNGPLLSVHELRRVEGFDEVLVEGLAPYVTVAAEGGVNLNTAPEAVLALVAHGPRSDRRLLGREEIERIMRARKQDQILCDAEGAGDRCILVSEVLDGGTYPEQEHPVEANIFLVRTRARVGDVLRRVEAVVDRNPEDPRILSWKVR